MNAPFGIGQDHRNSMARAIHGFLYGSKGFPGSPTEKQRGALEYLANRLEADEMTELLYKAASYVSCLPYTQPPPDSEPIAFALFCAAAVLLNNSFESVHKCSVVEALAAIIEIVG